MASLWINFAFSNALSFPKRVTKFDLFAFLSPYIKSDKDSPFFYVQRFVKRYFRPLYTDENGNLIPSVSEIIRNWLGDKFVGIDAEVLKKAQEKGNKVHSEIEKYLLQFH